MPDKEGLSMRLAIFDNGHRFGARALFALIRVVSRQPTPYALVARQLAHADVTMVARIYGRYSPRSDERDRSQKIAAKLDAPQEIIERNDKADELAAKVGATPKKNSPTTRK